MSIAARDPGVKSDFSNNNTRSCLSTSNLVWVRRAVTPDFGSLAAVQYRLEGAFRAVHTRLRTHAESVAFFGGGAAEVCLLLHTDCSMSAMRLLP